MAQNIRQSRLFAAEDYTAIYESYVNANLQAYDYDTLRDSMIAYVRETYPENFNDWIESSEFVAILDLVAQFGHNLAFRVDLNSRNNFLSTAERQDAVYKLAEFLGYQPRRILPAFGQMKVISVRTNESVLGSQGTSLGGIEIRYENTDNIDNLDDFITVMNAILAPTSQFGSPRKQATVNNILTQFYNLNNTPSQTATIFSAKAMGSSASYELIGMEYDSERRIIKENTPDPNGAFSLIYKNDGTGITSNNTGFFIGVKQGTTQFEDFNIQDAIDNLSIDISASNVNETDVWLQRIDTNGNVLENWTKVDNTFGSSVAYNSLTGGNRNIFSVKSRENNQISIQFADRKFGNLPKGTFRVWYRTSINDTYVVRPADIGIQKMTIRYVGADNNIYTATFEVQLKESITNASASETLDDIKVNAPRIYATQDRMITAQDYSSYLVRQSDNILKIKSVNRTHSGHSRYVDYNDPTGAYGNLKLYATDATVKREVIFRDYGVRHNDAKRMVREIIEPALASSFTTNLYYEMYRDEFISIEANKNRTEIKWQNIYSSGNISTGYFLDNTNSIMNVGDVSTTYMKYASPDALIKFRTPDNEFVWARLSNMSNNGLGLDNQNGQPSGKILSGSGAIVLDVNVPQDSVVVMIYPALNRQITETSLDDIILNIEEKESFSLRYDYTTRRWLVVPESTLEPSVEDWVLFVSWNVEREVFVITHRQQVYRMLTTDIDFSNTNNLSALDEYSKKVLRDTVTFITYGNDVEYKKVYVQELRDGNNVWLTMEDKNNDSRPDDPDVFFDLMGNDGFVDNQRFEWEHVPATNEIVDPSFTNIVDVFALTRVYDTNYRKYLKDATGTVKEPLPPTIDELNQQFAQISNKKAMSDKIIYRPVKYKPIFGIKAEPEHRGKLSVVKVENTNITDNEIKSRVVDAVNSFFDLGNWDFGETFYFTELAAHVHKQLPGIISSLVIVPEYNNSVFGDLFEITANTDEIFIPDVGIDNVNIISNINETTINMA